ncbi:MAG: DUF3347 domain-containing protein [Bacteriovoracaceae bacterium]|nr:DUF3347 domain-containing protein [Bacteriovoracaceae bacterium]
MIKKTFLVALLLLASAFTFADTKSELESVMDNYDQLHSSFFTYNAGKIELSAQKLKKSIAKISDKSISSKLVFASKKLDEMKVTNDKKMNNELLNTVSMALIYILKSHGEEKYKGHLCPMVKKQWIQNIEKNSRVMNPYAPEMPHCGEQI